MSAFQDELRRRFRAELLGAVERRLREEGAGLDVAHARERVDAGLAEAPLHGLVLGDQIEQLVWIFVRHGAGVGSLPWARAILHDPGLTQDEKLSRLQAAPLPSEAP